MRILGIETAWDGMFHVTAKISTLNVLSRLSSIIGSFVIFAIQNLFENINGLSFLQTFFQTAFVLGVSRLWTPTVCLELNI